ncbi:MAG: serine/threonine-protein kinase, partial [Planctomycetota bacterium]
RLHKEVPALRKNQIPVELAVFIVSRIARGLAYAHRRTDSTGKPLNIVHRDICPRNIMVTTEGLPKLGDFGIAYATNVGTESGQPAVGKYSYMAPEQASSGEVDFRADIYSLGMVLFELLALSKARRKWDDNLVVAAVNGWVEWDALPESIPKPLKNLLEKMLSAYPSRRFDSTDELAKALEMYIYGKGYGPTVVTLEKYLRETVPGLYHCQTHSNSTKRQDGLSDATTVVVDREETTRAK